MLDCLNNSVAFVPVSCPCLASVPVAVGSVTTTSIGLYLSDIMPVDFISACGEDTMWTTLKRLRETAKVELHQQVLKRISKIGNVLSPWTGFIGNTEGVPLAAADAYSGIKLSVSRPRRGVVATIKEVMVWASTEGNKNLKVYNRYGTEVVASQVVNIASGESGRWVTKVLATPIPLPLWADDEYTVEYTLVWDAAGVIGNDNGCISCSGTPPVWKSWFDVVGTASATPSTMTSYTNTEKMNGLRPKITVECSFEDLMCISEGEVKIALAVCLQYQWAVKVMEFIIDSGQINKWTSLGGEYLEGLLQKNRFVLSENLEYLASILYTGDCVQCIERTSKASMRI